MKQQRWVCVGACVAALCLCMSVRRVCVCVCVCSGRKGLIPLYSELIVISLVQFGQLLYGVKWHDLFLMRQNPISQPRQYNSPRL